ncbi:hypothetical protein PAXINDRAFT_41744, partial [Paxillus involutus ATCC 200175]
LPKMQEAMVFVNALRHASLDDAVSKLDDDALHRLRNPPQEHLSIDSPGTKYSIETYLALEHSSQVAYQSVC